MVREEIVEGLKNAVERGYSLEMAKQSFISAGYPREEVEEAASFIHGGTLSLETGKNSANETQMPEQIKGITESALVQQTTPAQLPKQVSQQAPQQIPQQPRLQIMPSTTEKEPSEPVVYKIRRNWKLILLIGVLALLVLILILTLVFRENIIKLFT